MCAGESLSSGGRGGGYDLEFVSFKFGRVGDGTVVTQTCLSLSPL